MFDVYAALEAVFGLGVFPLLDELPSSSVVLRPLHLHGKSLRRKSQRQTKTSTLVPFSSSIAFCADSRLRMKRSDLEYSTN